MNFDYHNYKYIVRMQYQKITNLQNKAIDRPSKFRTRDWVEVNNDVNGICKTVKQIEFSTLMLKSFLCDYGGAYILVKGTITFAGVRADAENRRKRQRSNIKKMCAIR